MLFRSGANILGSVAAERITILSENSVDADALSTACFILGEEKGMELIESLEGTEAMFVTDKEELHYSSGFPR